MLARAGAGSSGHRRTCWALTGAPSTGGWLVVGQDDDQRGARLGARTNRATCLYSVGPLTRTMMQPCASAAKAPRRRTHSTSRHKSHARDAGHHHLEPSSATRHKRANRAEIVMCLSAIFLPLSFCGTQNDALGYDAIAHEVPERDQELTRQSHDHLFARAAGILGSSSKPLRQGAFLLEHEKAPR